MFLIAVLSQLLVEHGHSADTAQCLHNVCAHEVSQCGTRGDCNVLFTCVGHGDCANKFPSGSPIGRCLSTCSNSTAELDELTASFSEFWKQRNVQADNKLRSFKPLNLEFVLPAFPVVQDASILRRRLLQNSKTRLLQTIDQLSALADSQPPTRVSLFETAEGKPVFDGFKQLRDKIERDVGQILHRTI